MSDTSASSSTEGRAEKRARIEDPAGAASASPQAAAAAAFDALPDAVMSAVFRALGLRASWPLRGVSRRWRRSVEDTAWASFELVATIRADGKGRTQAGRTQDGEQAYLYSAVAELFGQRKLRLSTGASVALRPELFAFKGAKAAQQGHRRTVEAACSVLAAITGSRGGPAQPQPQPREVIVELRGAEALFAFQGETDADFLDACVLGVLRALAPPEGATSALESLSVGCVGKDIDEDMTTDRLAWPEADELRAALAPFGRLRSLALFSSNSFGIRPDAAAAIAAACPLLESLCVSADYQCVPEALAALAPLAHLERLVAAWPSADPDSSSDVSAGLAALADGPAGRSLRSVALFDDLGLYPEGEFPCPSPGAVPASSELGDAALLASLGRMPRLESFRSSTITIGPADGDASLREAAVSITSTGPDAAAALGALGEAISGLSRLERLTLKLDLRVQDLLEPSGLLGLLESAGARRALTSLDLSVFRPLEEAEAEAILALPALERLRLGSSSLGPSASLRPLEVLAGLRPGVAVEIEFDGEEDVRAEVRRMFAGRPPYS
eukprot:tig00000269_g23704.t1